MQFWRATALSDRSRRCVFFLLDRHARTLQRSCGEQPDSHAWLVLNHSGGMGKRKRTYSKDDFFSWKFFVLHTILARAVVRGLVSPPASSLTWHACVATTGTVRTWLSVLLFSLSTDYRAFHKGKAKSLLYWHFIYIKELILAKPFFI
jgi:hypothetical protein